jgi:ankyrin repeat protein
LFAESARNTIRAMWTINPKRLQVAACVAALSPLASTQGAKPKPEWAGPVKAELNLRFGPGGNAKASHASLFGKEEGDWGADQSESHGGVAGLALDVLPAGKRASYAARTLITLPEGAGMALGPMQYLSLEVFVDAERPCRMLVQLDELVGSEKLRGILAPAVLERGAWQKLTINLLRNELLSDSRIGSVIMPDRTPLTRFELRFDPRAQSGVREVRVRDLRLFRQDVLAKAPVDAADEVGQTALHRAAMLGDAARARALLEDGANVNARNKYLYTPLAHAVIAHDPATVQVLIEHGADVAAKRRRGFTPLYDAAADGQVEIIELLLAAGADPRQPTEFGYEPLFTAVHHGHIKATERLLADKRVDVNQATASAGFMALHVAAQGDEAGPHLALYERLIELGAQVDPCSAAAAGDVKRLQAMFEQNPKLAKATILGGWTPLHDAVRNARVEAVKLLLAHGADPNAISGDVDHRSTPLHWLGACVLIEDPATKLATLELLVEAGAKLNILDRHGGTALDRARQFRSTALSEAMRKLGALSGRELKAQKDGKKGK